MMDNFVNEPFMGLLRFIERSKTYQVTLGVVKNLLMPRSEIFF